MARLFSRVLCALVIATALASVARATDVTVNGVVVTNSQIGGSVAYVRAQYDQTFVDSLGNTVVGGLYLNNFYTSVRCAVAGSQITCPPFTLASTTDSSVPSARVTLVLYDSANRSQLATLFNWRVPPSPASTTAQQLNLYTAGQPRPLGDAYMTRDQVIQYFTGSLFSGRATTATAGIGKSSMNVADPVFVETTDPRVQAASTSNPGVVALAASGDTSAGKAVQGSDARLAAASTTNRGTVTTTTATSTVPSTDDSRIDYATPKQYGALGDGTGATITSADVLAHGPGTQYPWAGTYSVGVDTKDYVGLQEAIYAAFYNGTLTPNGIANCKLNKELRIPDGDYRTNKTLNISHLVGGRIIGAGRFTATVRVTTANTPIFTTNGCAYSHFEAMQLSAGANNNVALFDLNWDNSPGGAALQSNTFEDIYFDGSGGTVNYGLRIGRGGYQGSENLILNCFFQVFTSAAWTTENFNALQNTMVGGNIQSCPAAGILVAAGSVNVYSVGFQDGILTQTGADVIVQNSANDTSGFYGCRTESLRFIEAVNGHKVIVEGLSQTLALRQWDAGVQGGALPVGYLLTGSNANGDGKLYEVTTAGTTGNSEPAWPGSGTVTTGSAVLTQIEFNSVAFDSGSLRNSRLQCGRAAYLSGGPVQSNSYVFEGNEFTRTDWLYGSPFDLGNSTVVARSNLVKVFGNGGVVKGYNAVSANGVNGQYTGATMPTLTGQPILFESGSGSVAGGSVGIGRGGVTTLPAGSYPQENITQNVLGIIGTLGPISKSGTNQTGDDFYLQGGVGTGTGGGGSLRLRTQPPTTTGTSVPNSLDRLVINQAGVTSLYKGADVASASTVVPTGNVFTLTGTTTVSTISTAGIAPGTVLHIITSGGLTFNEAGNIDISGGTSLTTGVNDLVIAVWDGTKWRLR